MLTVPMNIGVLRDRPLNWVEKGVSTAMAMAMATATAKCWT